MPRDPRPPRFFFNELSASHDATALRWKTYRPAFPAQQRRSREPSTSVGRRLGGGKSRVAGASIRRGERKCHGVGGRLQAGLSTGRSGSPGSDLSSRRRRPRRRGVRPCRGRRDGRRSRTAIALMAVVATMAVIQTAPIARPIQAQTLAPGVSPRPPRRPPRPSTTAITIGRSSVAAAPQVSARRTGSRCMRSRCLESGATCRQRPQARKSGGNPGDCRQA